MNRAAIYARESVDDTSRAPSITDQVTRATAYAQEKGLEITGVYADNGYSGGDWNRPQYLKLKADAKFHRFNQVIVWNQDRIARDTEQFLNFYRLLKDSGVTVYSITEGLIDMETLGGRVQHTSMAFAAEIFRRVTSEKVKRVHDAKKLRAQKEGTVLKWGRPKGSKDKGGTRNKSGYWNRWAKRKK